MTTEMRNLLFMNILFLMLFSCATLLIPSSIAIETDDVQSQAESPLSGEAEEDVAEEQKLVTNIFCDTSLRQAIADISAHTGVIIIPDISVQGIVSCELVDVPLDKALEILLAGSGYVVKKMPDYYFITSVDPTSPSFPQISESHLVNLNYVKADAAIKLLSPAFQKYVQADPESRVAFVTAPRELADRIVSALELIDQAPRQIALDTRIVVMERGELASIGVQWKMPQVEFGAFSSSITREGKQELEPGGVKWPWGIEIGYTPGREFTDSLLLTLNLMAQNDQATIIANPQLMAQDGKEAQINVTTEEYFEILTEGGFYARSQLEKIEVGTTLTITPRISDNGNITLDISTEVSDVIARGEDNLPVVTRRMSQGTVRIQDGGTAVVAGLTDDRWQINHVRVPGPANVAVLGRLFRNKTRRESTRQVAAFVTVHIIPEGEPEHESPPHNRPYIEPVGEEFREALKDALSRADRAE